MRTKESLLRKIEMLERDQRLYQPPAEVKINAWLAFIQISSRVEYDILRWCLGEPISANSWVTIKEHKEAKNGGSN